MMDTNTLFDPDRHSKAPIVFIVCLLILIALDVRGRRQVVVLCVTTFCERGRPMHEQDSPFPIVNSHGRLECRGIWGGILNRDIEIAAGKVIGSIYSAACEGGQGGDIYYFGVCKGDIITRLAIADVTGHGEAVSEVSQYVYDSLKAHM